MKTSVSFRYINIFLILLLVGILAFGLPQPAQAAGIIDNGTIPAGEVIYDDVVLTGQSVRIDGTVNGMAIAMGETVTINGTVNGDLLAFGSNVVINGTVTGNIFAGAQTVELKGKVEGSLFSGATSLVVDPEATINRNLYFGGFSANTKPGSKVGIDLFLGGYQGLLQGEIGRDVHASSAALEVSGTINGNLTADVAEPGTATDMAWMKYMPQQTMTLPEVVNPGLRVLPGANIAGKLTYTSPAAQSQGIQSAPEQGIVYQTPVPQTDGNGQPVNTRPSFQFSVGHWFLDRLRDLFTLLALGGLAIWLIPGLMKNLTEQAQKEPLPAAGYGLLTVILGYFGAFIAAVLLLGAGLFLGILTFGALSKIIFGVGFSTLGLFVALFSLLVSYGSKLVIAYLVGRWVYHSLAPNNTENRVWPMVIGVVLYVLARSVPLLGWLVGLLATLLGLGALYLLYRSYRQGKAAAVAVETAAPVQ